MSRLAKWRLAVDDTVYRLGENSTDALFELIHRESGIERIAAETMLAGGKMIIAANIVVVQEDVIQALHRAETSRPARKMHKRAKRPRITRKKAKAVS